MNMNTDTPRTDDQSVRYYDDATGTRIKYVAAKFACQLERELAQRERERDEYKAALQSADNHNHEIATKLEIVTEQRDRLAGLKYPEDLTVDFVKILLETVKCGGKVVTFNDSDICTMERILKGGSHES